MSDDLVKRLRNRAESWLEYECEEDAKIVIEAVDRIEDLQRELADANARIEYLEEEIVDLGYEMRELESRQ
jgi:polyhydroxyalkanoate synthesis regulator phasin